jgi:hypothetical protein
MPFELKLSEKTVVLEWGTYSMKRFCEFKNLTISKFIEWLSTGDYSMGDIVMIFQAAAEHGSKGKAMFTDFEVCEWIDERNAATGEFMAYIINKTVSNVSNTIKGEDEEKKTLV